ncbi:hypothetical protein [Streptomyces aureocirculatus]|uniref:hypothetical protein n=1 Tax=Streptomyces aureocirculatus TaxID=67275 RepID=UPI0012FE9B7A|nr:hypothetical protein [Streptomyces aureocirculatus]
MIDVERIRALSELPSPRRAAPSQPDAAGIVRALSGLRNENAAIAQPIAWSKGLCAQHPLKEGDAHAPVAFGMAERVCRICPIRAACRDAVGAATPPQARRWRSWTEAGDSSAEQ